MFVSFTVCVFREGLSVCARVSFPFVFGGGMCWILIVLVHDHCLFV